MSTQLGRRRGEILMLLGAILLFMGPVLEFVSIEPSQAGLSVGVEGGSLTGYESGDGASYVVFGALVVLSALGLFAVTALPARRMLALLGLLGALVCLYAGFIDMTAKDPTEVAQLRQISSGPGTWVVTLGAVVAVVGAIFAFLQKRFPAMAGGAGASGGDQARGEEDRPEEIDMMSNEVPRDHSQSAPDAEEPGRGPSVGDAFRGGS